MKTGLKLFLICAVIAAFGSLVVFFAISQNKSEQTADTENEGQVAGATTQEVDSVENLARALSEKGMVLYGSYQSELSQEQKELFGSSAQLLDCVECDAAGPEANTEECQANKIESYPTWIFEGTKYIGVQKLGDLAKVINFSN